MSDRMPIFGKPIFIFDRTIIDRVFFFRTLKNFFKEALIVNKSISIDRHTQFQEISLPVSNYSQKRKGIYKHRLKIYHSKSIQEGI